MANDILTSQVITRRAVDVLESKLAIVKNIDRSHEPVFMGDSKIGPSLQIKKPAQMTVREGWPMNTQEFNQDYVTLTVGSPIGVDLEFSDAELALSLGEFSANVIEPAVSRLAAGLEQRVGLYMKNNTANLVGTIGTQPNSVDIFMQAKERLSQNLVPDFNNIACVIGPATERSAVAALSTLQNPANAIGKQYDDGAMSHAFGFNWYMSQVLSSHTNGTRTDTTPANTVVPAQGATSITLAAAGNALTYKAGDVFTCAGIYAVNPETKQTLPYLKQFCVAADVTSESGGACVVTVTEPIYQGTSSARQNCTTWTTASKLIINLTAGGSGAASGVYSNDLVFHKQAFSLVTADLQVPKGVDMAYKSSNRGMSVRFVRQWDNVNARMTCRLDMFYGIVAVRPEWSCRIIGAKAN